MRMGDRGDIAAYAGSFLVGLGAGIITGLVLGKRRYQKQLDAEVADAKAYYNYRIKAATSAVESRYSLVEVGEAPVGPSDRNTGATEGPVGTGVPANKTPENRRPATPVVVRDESRTNYATPPQPSDEENVVHLPTERSPYDPYVITAAEFFEDHNDDYQKLTLTYYYDGDVLTDDKDAPIRDLVGTVGDDIGAKMGQKSNDPNIVYIRNDRLQIDFEVTKDDRSYTEVVLGYGNPKIQAKKRIDKP